MIAAGGLGFLSPWLLLALVALPVIWWLLRITPPAPRRQPFPPLRLLRSLVPTEDSAATSPWWLLLLRLILAALVILALAHPVLNPTTGLVGQGPMLLVVDDGWAAAHRWSDRQRAMLDYVAQAEREDRAVQVLSTAPAADGSPVQAQPLAPATKARPYVRALAPKPWAVDRAGAARAVARLDPELKYRVVWLADGIDDGNAEALARALARVGEIIYVGDAPGQLARALAPPAEPGGALTVQLLRPEAGAEESRWVRASGAGGRLLGRVEASFAADALRTDATVELPSELRNKVERIEIEGGNAAAAVVLADERWRRRPVGLVTGDASEHRAQPLLSSIYYLERALGPFASVQQGSTDDLLRRRLAVLFLADIGQLPDDEQAVLRQWVSDGGMLVRFAGPRLAQNADELIPVRLRSGGRLLGGALSWDQPATLAPFPETGPFNGVAVPEDVLVRRQVLAEPSLDLPEKTWAQLADGTPLVTAERQGQGWLVLFHVTANTEWSSLPISGLFVEMLRRVVALSRGVADADAGQATLPPVATLDGEGRLGAPPPTVTPLNPANLPDLRPGPSHPPGYYGTEDARQAVNLATGWADLRAIGELPVPAQRATYAARDEIDLKPWLLAAAILLAVVDVLAVLALRGLLFGRGAARAAAVVMAALLAWPQTSRAQGGDEYALQATLETRLAYVITGDGTVDELSRAGLSGLSDALRRRTSVEPAEPMAINVERDELLFFPLIYWPITAAQARLSPSAVGKIDAYMRTGGTILFDTRDANIAGPGILRGGGNNGHLRRLLGQLDIPPLGRVPENHVLTKAFYLMQTFPGRYGNGAVWLESTAGTSNDGVSSIVIGGNDWAAAWAIDSQGRPMAATVPNTGRQRELAYRFGINLVMYTLTGNYKADQVHVPAILERLGQ
ncbi:MAG: DUF4159 domain-containing protein [Alphaproteobacteria bacterium]